MDYGGEGLAWLIRVVVVRLLATPHWLEQWIATWCTAV